MTHRSRAAYTLTELLVVITIMAGLMGLVVANSRPSRGTSDDIRRGARQLASLLLNSQSQSLGSRPGAAVIIQSGGFSGETMSHARRYPFIEGRVNSGMPPTDPRVTQVTVNLTTTNDSADSLVHGYRIRFFDRGADTQGPLSDWFSFSCLAAPTAVVRQRTENGQTAQTTLWPTVAVGGTLAFQAERYPIPIGVAEILPKGVVVDLRNSGYGDPTVAGWGSLANRGAIAIGFDSIGSMDTLMQNVLPADGSSRTVQPLYPAEEVYLFVTCRRDVEDPAVNALSNPDALWVVIHPKSGRVTISANVPQQNSDVTALRAARSNARQGITIGG